MGKSTQDSIGTIMKYISQIEDNLEVADGGK